MAREMPRTTASDIIETVFAYSPEFKNVLFKKYGRCSSTVERENFPFRFFLQFGIVRLDGEEEGYFTANDEVEGSNPSTDPQKKRIAVVQRTDTSTFALKAKA